MLILQKLKSLITSQDINGNVVNFNFSKDSNKHKSMCGGLLSIVFVISLLFFGLTKFVQMINYDNITNGSYVQEVDPLKINIPDLS